MKSAKELFEESIKRADSVINYSPRQPRGSDGKWTSGGGSMSSGSGGKGNITLKKSGTVKDAPGLKSVKEANKIIKDSQVKHTVYLIADGNEAKNIEKKGISNENLGEHHGALGNIVKKVDTHTQTKGILLMDSEDSSALSVRGDGIVSAKINVKNPAKYKDSSEYFDKEDIYLKSIGAPSDSLRNDSGLFKNHLLEKYDAILIGGNTNIIVKSPAQVIPTSIHYR